MPREVGVPAEGLPALAAGVGLLARVHPLVLGQGRGLPEGLAARVRPLARVHAPVDGQRRALQELLPARVAPEGLLAGVEALVLRQR